MSKFRKRKGKLNNKRKRRLIMNASLLVILFLGMGFSALGNNLGIFGSINLKKHSIYTITLDNQSATTAGTTKIYEKYGTGYYLDSNLTNQMTTSANGITTPIKTGYSFRGYYTQVNGGGTQYIDENGKLTSSASTTNFTADGTLYAYWIRIMAENISYDNTNTSLDCSDTQCAIDKLYEMLK